MQGARPWSPIEGADQRLWQWLTFAPALAMMLALSILPLANLFVTSFQDVAWVDGQPVRSWAGLTHYRALFDDQLFGAGLTNTVIFAFGAVAGQMVIGFALAVLCSKIGRGRILYRAVFILPILIPGIVIGAIWKLMYSFDFGVLNQMLALFGARPVDWLGNPSTALVAVIAVDIWHWTPFVYLLLLAGLESLPQDIYESAKVDGATFLQELRYITLPLMLPTIAVTLVFRTLVAFKVFDEIYLLTAGGPGTATEVVSYTIYRRFFTEGQMGYGSALSVLVLFALALLFILARAGMRKRTAD